MPYVSTEYRANFFRKGNKSIMTYKSIGKNLSRVEAIAKATGSAKYTADLRFPRELFARVVRSSEPHALIKKISCEEALAIPGVRGIVTGENSHETIGVCIKDQPPLARGKVRFVGEPVAAVVAETKEIALAASLKVKVEYESLPAVFECKEAMAEDAPLIHEHIPAIPGFFPKQGTNIFQHFRIRTGDPYPDKFEQKDYSASAKIHWPHLAHCQMEPHVTIARWANDDSLEVYTSAQSPFDVRHFLCEAFHLPMRKVSVITYFLGGGFGGKSDVTIEPLTVLVAKHFPGEYVRIQLDREEMFFGTVVGRGLDGEFTVDFDKEGMIHGLKVTYLLNSGGYAGYAINIVQPGGIVTSGTYYIPYLEIDAYGVYTNKPPLGAYRAYGHPEAALLAERMIELVAERTGRSSSEIRRLNLIKPGHKNSIGQTVREDDGNILECMQFVEEDMEKYRSSHEQEIPLTRGYALANFLKAPGMPTNGFSTAIVRFNEDTTVNVMISATDMGQGLLTTITQIAAEALLMPVHKIEVTSIPDTRYTPYEWQTVASRSTWMVGNAVYKAAQDAIQKIKENAAIAMGQSAQDMVYDGKQVYYLFDKEKSIPIKNLMLGYTFPNGRTCGSPPVGYGAYMPEMEYSDEKTGQGNAASQWTYGCQGVVLDVDITSGQIFVRMVSSALDIGKVINPKMAKSQVEGAVIMGIGGAIMEKIQYDSKGKIRNPEFTDYKIPTPEDTKGIEMYTHFVETFDQKMVYGAKCLGEHPVIGIAPAILAAVKDATGLEFDALPLQAEIVRKKIQENYTQVLSHIEKKRAEYVYTVSLLRS